MKSLFYTLAIVIFSAIIFSPPSPKNYPTVKSLEQRQEIIVQEKKIESLIEQIESKLVRDSISICKLRKNE